MPLILPLILAPARTEVLTFVRMTDAGERRRQRELAHLGVQVTPLCLTSHSYELLLMSSVERPLHCHNGLRKGRRPPGVRPRRMIKQELRTQ